MGAAVTRRTIAAALAALALGACGDDAKPPPIVGIGTSLSTLPSNPTSTSTGVTTTTGRSAVSRVTTTAAPHPATTAENNAIAEAAQGEPGGFAGVLLAPGPAQRLVVDVLVQPGAAVTNDVIARQVQILGAQSGKSVTLHGPSPFDDDATTHDAASIRRLADMHGVDQGAGAAVVHLLYLRGSFSEDGVLGVTVRADTTAVFPDEIASASSALVARSRIERAVVTHEVGHILGLVDLWLNDHRADAKHPGHSANPRSVMYWAVESDLISQVLTGQPPVDFDAADLADLQRIREGASAAT